MGNPSALTAANTALPERLLQFRDMFAISRFDDTNYLYGRHFRSAKRAIMSNFFYAGPD